MIYTLEVTKVLFSLIIIVLVGLFISSFIFNKDYVSKASKVCTYIIAVSTIALFIEVGIKYHYLGYKLVKDESHVCQPPTFVIDSTKYNGDFIYENDKFYIKRTGTNTVIIAR